LKPYIKQQTKNKQMPFLLTDYCSRLHNERVGMAELVSSVGGSVMSASNGELIVGGQQRNLMIPTRLPVLASIAVIAVMIFNCGVAIAGPDEASADYFMPGCRDAASLITLSVRESEEEAARMNFCAGIVVGLSFMGELHGICVPPDTTTQQAASVVVQYIDGRPARTAEDFRSFAVEALRANWPCPPGNPERSGKPFAGQTG
jgi:hypothetical protein